MDRRTNGQMDRWTDGQMSRLSKLVRDVYRVCSVGRQQEDFVNSITNPDTNLAIIIANGLLPLKICLQTLQGRGGVMLRPNTHRISHLLLTLQVYEYLEQQWTIEPVTPLQPAVEVYTHVPLGIAASTLIHTATSDRMDTFRQFVDGVHAFAPGRLYLCNGCDAKRHMGAHFHCRLEWCDRFYSPLLLKILVESQGQTTECVLHPKWTDGQMDRWTDGQMGAVRLSRLVGLHSLGCIRCAAPRPQLCWTAPVIYSGTVVRWYGGTVRASADPEGGPAPFLVEPRGRGPLR
eukprot:5934756-Pyramimonas_sp.AAC.3